MQRRYKGVFPVVPTTFHEDGSLDLDSQKRCLDFMIDAGSNGLCILANFSEQFSLSDEEREVITRTCLEHVAGRVPVIVTTTHYGTRVCAERSRAAQDMGAAMVMVMPPYHGATFRVPEAQIFEFYARVSDAIGIPIMVQDAPASGTVLSAPFLAKMAKEIEHVSYFKMETPFAADKLAALIEAGGKDIIGPFDGEEAVTLLADLDAGCTGTMTSALQPEKIRPILMQYRAGDIDKALDQWRLCLPLINHENRQCGLRAAKTVMMEGGVIKSDHVRAPLQPMSQRTKERLLQLSRELDVIALKWGK